MRRWHGACLLAFCAALVHLPILAAERAIDSKWRERAGEKH